MPHGSIVVVVNPRAGSADLLETLMDRLEDLGDVALRMTERSGDGARLARQAAAEGARWLLIAGGDGTVSEVVQAVAGDRLDLMCGVIPLGTGNDFVRTLGFAREASEAVLQLDLDRHARLDVLRLQTRDGSRYATNAVTGGFSAVIDDNLDDRSKRLLGRLSFLVSAGSSLGELEAHDVTLRIDGGKPLQRQLVNFVVANGRFAGGGAPVAPSARPDDGVADLLMVPALGAEELAHVVRTIGDEEEGDTGPLRGAGRSIRVEATPPMDVTCDGEPAGSTPITVEVVEGAVQWLVGPEFDSA
jgi:diacylglycerol kinase (ATP)